MQWLQIRAQPMGKPPNFLRLMQAFSFRSTHILERNTQLCSALPNWHNTHPLPTRQSLFRPASPYTRMTPTVESVTPNKIIITCGRPLKKNWVSGSQKAQRGVRKINAFSGVFTFLDFLSANKNPLHCTVSRTQSKV